MVAVASVVRARSASVIGAAPARVRSSDERMVATSTSSARRRRAIRCSCHHESTKASPVARANCRRAISRSNGSWRPSASAMPRRAPRRPPQPSGCVIVRVCSSRLSLFGPKFSSVRSNVGFGQRASSRARAISAFAANRLCATLGGAPRASVIARSSSSGPRKSGESAAPAPVEAERGSGAAKVSARAAAGRRAASESGAIRRLEARPAPGIAPQTAIATRSRAFAPRVKPFERWEHRPEVGLIRCAESCSA